MNYDLKKGYITGIERISAWADLLDNINVYPVADGDTGRNLIISLMPLRYLDSDKEKVIHQLLLSARGNSGNIAASFLSGFLTANSVESLPEAAKLGRDRAWSSINNPAKGTMLTLFDALVDALQENNRDQKEYVSKIIDHLEKTVQSTPELLPKLKQAGVVDSGALGMFIFLEGFFNGLFNRTEEFRPISAIFKNMLQVLPSFYEEKDKGYCVDMVVHVDDNTEDVVNMIPDFDESAMIIEEKHYLKVHMHIDDKETIMKKIESVGNIINWSEDNIGEQIKSFKRKKVDQAIHIITDAAGSVTREDANNFSFTLLDSYITIGSKSLPETLYNPEEVYESMENGLKVSTSQASVFERHQYFQSILNRYEKALYLCVGSVFTGNYQTAMDWKRMHDPEDRLVVIDTGSASGRLGTIVLAAAEYSAKAKDADSVIDFSKKAINRSEEYLFLDKLHFLAAGGRLSKTSAFFGDMLNMKPIISPTAEGAKKVGVVRTQKDQIKFALEKLHESLSKDSSSIIMLEYSNNKSWVHDNVKNKIEKYFPSAHIILQPLSLTTGAHTGPGTWAIAFLPQVILN